MMDFLTRQKAVDGTPSIQPSPSEIPFVNANLKQKSVFTTLENPFSSQIMSIMPVGFNTPNPVDFSGVPSYSIPVTGIPSVKWSDAPVNKGGCK